MKRLVILIVISLLCVGSLWAQSPETEQKIVRKGTSVTGQMRDGCETIRFVDSVGGIKKLPHLERTGRRLKFNVVTVGTPQDCGSTDEEAVVLVSVKDTGDFFPKIVERGVKYKIDSVKIDAFTGDTIPYIKYDSIYTKIDPTLCGCGDDTSFRIAVEKLQYNTRYLLWAYVKTVEGVYYRSDNFIMTKQRNKCAGWKANYLVESYTATDSIDLVYDREGNSYGVVQIGKQCWTRENIRCSRSLNKLILPARIIGYDTAGKAKYEASEQDPFRYDFVNLFLSERQRGYLYNWPAAVDTFGMVTYLPPGKRQGVCPDGWHLPNTYEWYELVRYELNGHANDADLSKVKKQDTINSLESFHAHEPEWQGDSVVKMTFGCDWPEQDDNLHRPGSFNNHPNDRNISGFSALPANNLFVDPKTTSYGTLGSKTVSVVANFWLATPAPDNDEKVNKFSYSWHIDFNQHGVSSYLRTRARGFSVRCLRDQLTISVDPNSCVFCVPSVVTYTAKVAQEPLEDFTFTWFVNGAVEQNSSSATFVYTHPSGREGLVDTVKCRAVRIQNITPETEQLEDSVFVKGSGICHVIKVSPSTLTRCVGDTLRVTAQRPGYNLKNDYNLAWKINGKDLSSADLEDLHITPVSPDTTFRLAFPNLFVDSTYMLTVTVEITPKAGIGAIDIPNDTLLVAVSSIYPSITVCSNCNSNVFVIKKQENISTATNVTDNVIWRDHDGHAVAYKRAKGDTVHIDEINNPYYVEMLATGGCRDTLRNVVLKDPVRGCTVEGRQNNEEGPADEREIWYVFDHEHNYRYPVVQIGDRCWMKENMRAVTSPCLSQRRTIDPSVNDTIISASGSRVAHWYADNRNKNARYGVLYNWFAAVDTALDGGSMSCPLPVNWRGICPEGWHIPTTQEWTAMEVELNGGENVTNASDTLASLLSGGCDWKVTSNTTHSPGNYRDSIRGNSGFDALPAGYFNDNNGSQQNNNACFWTATEGLDANMADQRTFTYYQATIDRSEKSKNMGMSVRCVRNIPTLAINHKYNGNCTYQLYSTIDNLPNGLTYEWKINGQVMPGSDSTLNFYFTADTNRYHIVCVATKNGGVYKDSMDIELPNWPPTLTACSDPYARPIKVSSQHVSSAIWYNEQGDSVHNAISGYVDLPADNYVVYLTNSNNVCLPDTVTVIEPQNTYCRVTSRNASIETAYDGDNYAIDSVKDGDNNYYHVVQIGNLCWTRENMRVTGGLTEGTDYYDPDTFPLVQRGYLYTKSTADAICPEGWHLPTLQEWRDMLQNVMGNENKTYMLTGGCDWKNYNGNTPGNFNVSDRNLSGLTLIPVGNLTSEGGFEKVTTHASLWTATDKDASNSYLVRFAYNANTMESKSVPKNLAYSVRCVRDLPQFVLQCFVVNPNNSIEHRVNGDNPMVIDSVSDANGNWYGVVQVNGRCWTRENLRATKDSSSADLIDGTKRPISTDGSGNTVDKDLKLYYDFNPNSYAASSNNDKVDIPEALRGYLYNWSAALTVCPKGWHLPSSDEYTDLVNYAENNTNMAMLAGYSEYWKSSNTQKHPGYCRTHSSDYCDSLKFSLVPAGNMSKDGKFDYGGRSANLWTSTEVDSGNANRACFDYNLAALNTSYKQDKKRGFSVRCIRDL